MNVNRPVEYSLDLKSILPSLERTLELMSEAESHLTVAKEQIKYAQFWFLQKMSPLDDTAFNHLLAGNLARAIEIWSKQESLSSLQNKLVCYLIESKIELAVKTAERLYEKFGDDYISKIDANCTLQMTATDLLHQFVDSLGEEIGMQTMLGFNLGADTKAYINSQTIGPLINKISSDVDKTKKVDHKDPKARIEAARKLVTNTKEAFSQLKGILPASDSQYQMIADKLGLEILQCGIDYFNNSDDDDASYTAMKMQKYALSVVVGTLAKQRCEENIRILQTNIDNLPPKEVITEDKAIKAELAKFVRLPDKITHAITLLNNTKPHLQSIRQKLGATNEYYLKSSTQIVGNALHNVVGEVNEAQEPLARLSEILGKMDPTMRSILLSGSNEIAQKFREIEAKVKSTLREAWKATLLMDEFDTENDFKVRYRENRNTLKSLCSNLGVSTSERRINPATRTISTSSPRPTSTSRTSTPRTSTAYSGSSTSSSSSSDNNGCIVALVIMGIVGIIGAFANGGEGFFVGLFWGAIIGGFVYKIMSD